MISKRIDRKKENDNYGNLALYVRGGKSAPLSSQNLEDSPDDYGSAARYISDSEHDTLHYLFMEINLTAKTVLYKTIKQSRFKTRNAAHCKSLNTFI